MRRITIYLPPDLAKRLVVHCAEEGRDISDVVAEVLGQKLA